MNMLARRLAVTLAPFQHAQAHVGFSSCKRMPKAEKARSSARRIALCAGEPQLLQGTGTPGRGPAVAGVLDETATVSASRSSPLPVQDDAEAWRPGGCAPPGLRR